MALDNVRPLKGRDGIALWMSDARAGGRYLLPRRDDDLGQAVEYYGWLQDQGKDFGLVLAGDVPENASENASGAIDLAKDILVPLPLRKSMVVEKSSSSEPKKNLEKARVICAIIDDTILPMHPHTQTNNGSTRFHAIWHQDAPANAHAYGFGRVWYQDEINAILSHDTLAQMRHEFAQNVSRPAGWPSGAVSLSHGSAVVDLFAGCDPRSHFGNCQPDEVAIIAVQLPANVYWDSAGLALGFFLSHALDFIIDTAEKLGGAHLPLVINLSYGMTAGPHDGSSFIEAMMSRKIEARRQSKRSQEVPTELVLPIGNGFEAKRIWQVDPNVEEMNFNWVLPPSRPAPSFLEIWIDPEMFDEVDAEALALDVSVTSPDQQQHALEAFAPGHFVDLQDKSGEVFGRITYEENPSGETGNDGKKRFRLCVMLAPTKPLDDTAPRTRSGLWQVRLERTEKFRERLQVQAWIHRDNDVLGFPTSFPASHFRYPDLDTEHKQRAISLSAKATTDKAMIAAGWRLSDGRVAPYSAAYDPVLNEKGRHPADKPPDGNCAPPSQLVFALPSESSVALPGLRVAGNAGHRFHALNGTSAAAPLLARYLAEGLTYKEDIASLRLQIWQEARLDDTGFCEIKPPKTLAPKNAAARPGHVPLKDWLEGEREFPPKPKEHDQSRIGQGFLEPSPNTLERIRRR